LEYSVICTGMKVREDLSGQTINNREILKMVGTSYDHSLYGVKCLSCGNIYTITKSNLLRTETCSNCAPRKLKGPLSKQWKGGKIVPMNYFNGVKFNADARNIKFTITLNYIEKLFQLQNEKCKFTDEQISFVDSSASLDRIDNSKGYVKGNVQWVHKDINLMKNKRNERDFINYCITIHHYTHHTTPSFIPRFPPCKHKNFKGFGYIPKDFYTSLKKGAEKRNLNFEISMEDLNKRFLLQGGMCGLTGKDLFFTKHYKHGSYKKHGNASLDRINNNKGYTKNNIQWLDKHINMIKYKFSQERLFDICKKITKKFTTNVAISGYFQIAHAGHIDYIKGARELGGYLIAIINSDKQAKLKNTPSVINEQHRAKLIESIKGVDEVVLSIDEDESVSKTLEMIRPAVFCNGGDRTPSNYASKETEVCNKLGIKMVYLGGEKVDSSSAILDRAHRLLAQ